MSPHLVNDNSIQDISFNNNNNLQSWTELGRAEQNWIELDRTKQSWTELSGTHYKDILIVVAIKKKIRIVERASSVAPDAAGRTSRGGAVSKRFDKFNKGKLMDTNKGKRIVEFIQRFKTTHYGKRMDRFIHIHE